MNEKPRSMKKQVLVTNKAIALKTPSGKVNECNGDVTPIDTRRIVRSKTSIQAAEFLSHFHGNGLSDTERDMSNIAEVIKVISL
jgi:hypothetical protein